MIIYISGPITGDPDYLWKFCRAEKFLRDRGHKTINPARLIQPLESQGIKLSYEDYIDIDKKWLKYADGIYMLEGWNHSKGANIEITTFSDHGRNSNIFHEKEKEGVPWGK